MSKPTQVQESWEPEEEISAESRGGALWKVDDMGLQ